MFSLRFESVYFNFFCLFRANNFILNKYTIFYDLHLTQHKKKKVSKLYKRLSIAWKIISVSNRRLDQVSEHEKNKGLIMKSLLILAAVICIAIIIPTTARRHRCSHHRKCDTRLCPITKQDNTRGRRNTVCRCPVCTGCNCSCPRVPTPSDEEKCRGCRKNPRRCVCPECPIILCKCRECKWPINKI